MGKDLERGFLNSEPRKVQWAFIAADVLLKVRTVLVQLDLVKVVIPMSILVWRHDWFPHNISLVVSSSVVGGSHHQEPSQRLSSRRRPHQKPQRVNGRFNWNPNEIDEGNDVVKLRI
jgi:hypothetical protein